MVSQISSMKQKRANTRQADEPSFSIPTDTDDDKINSDLLHKIDFRELEAADPSQDQGFELDFEGSIAAELQLDEESTTGEALFHHKLSQGQTTLEELKVKLFVVGEKNMQGKVESPMSYKLELQSD